jgi:carbamoyltransferase
MKDIVGISAFFHDSSVALIRDGELNVFIKEEWLTRIKGTSAFPVHALEFLESNYGVSVETIEKVAFFEKPLRGWTELMSYSLKKPFFRWRQTSTLLKSFWDGPLFFGHHLKKIYPVDKDQICYCPHHLSHALTALAYANNTSEWTAIVVDGVGDGDTASIFHIKDGNIDCVWREKFPNSLGLFYSAITDYLGFNVNDGEYKVMGMSAYGNPEHKDFMHQEIIGFSSEKLELDLSWFAFDYNPERSFSDKFVRKFGPPASTNGFGSDITNSEFRRLANIASSAQAVTEEILEKLTRFAIRLTGCGKILFSGGVGQNCLAMAKLAELEDVSEFIVPPSPGDSGSAIGAAIFANMVSGHPPISAPGIYPGASPPPLLDDSLGRHLFRLVSAPKEMMRKSAELIKSGEIIATWFDRPETGPRALGNRSLICDAGQADVVDKLNTVIKQREMFRPLAPLMHKSTAEKYFNLNKKAEKCYEWMGLTAIAKASARKNIPSALHIDGTARLQVIGDGGTQISNLINAVEKNDIEVVVNTSFNIAGDPIVFDIIDAYVNMKRMGICWLLTDDGLMELLDE